MWTSRRLSEVATIVGGGTPSTTEPSYYGDEIPWITPKDLAGHQERYIARGERSITAEGLAGSSARLLPSGTVLLSSRAPIGYVAIASCSLATNQGFKSLILNRGHVPEFFYYLLVANQELLKSRGSGTTFAELSGTVLGAIEFDIPEPAEQRAIAEVLGALDDKIEQNDHMNATLDEIGRALFKSWFVDFDPVRAKAAGRQPSMMDAATAVLFPDSFEESALGPIPAGWRAGTIGELAEVIDCLHSKKPQRTDAGRLLLQLWNIRGDGIVDPSNPYFVLDTDYDQWISRMEARQGDCVVTNVGRVGAVAQVPSGLTAALGRNMTGVRVRASFPYPTFLISALRSDAMRDEIAFWTDAGSVMDALNVRSIPKLRLTLPVGAVFDAFESQARPSRALMEVNSHESRTLAELRDTLLPKLISGEIRVRDAAREVGAVV